MAVEKKRICGYRKAGGLYVMADLGQVAAPAWLPFCTDYEFTRSITWADRDRLFRTVAPEGKADLEKQGYTAKERVALLWVGDSYYTPESWMAEAVAMGVSKRVGQLPTGLEAGDPLAVASLHAIDTAAPSAVCECCGLNPYGIQKAWEATHCEVCRRVPAATAVMNGMVTLGRSMVRKKERAGMTRRDPWKVAGVFGIVRIRAIELVLPASLCADPTIQAKCLEHGVGIVDVPDNDPDHVTPGWKLPQFLQEKKPTKGKKGKGKTKAKATKAEPTTGDLFPAPLVSGGGMGGGGGGFTLDETFPGIEPDDDGAAIPPFHNGSKEKE